MAHTHTSKKVLVAVRDKDFEMVLDVLGTEFNAVTCYTFEKCVSLLDEHVALIVCGVHFDDGHLFDFLHHTKKNPKTQSIPFSVVLGNDNNYSQAIINGIQSAAELMGATRFIDLSRMKKEVGEEQAYEQIRQRIRTILSSDT